MATKAKPKAKASSNVDEVAAALNLTARRIQQLVKEGLPKAERGLYDLEACMLWYIKFLQKALETRSTNIDGAVSSLTAERTKAAKETSERLQMANMEKRGQVVVAEVIKQQVMQAIAYLNQSLEALPQRVTTDETLQNKIEEEIRACRSEFAGYLEKIGGRTSNLDRSGKDRKAKAKKNGG